LLLPGSLMLNAMMISPRFYAIASVAPRHAAR
jgi:hypothetical protein